MIKLSTYGKNISVSPALKEYLTDKLLRLEKYAGRIESARADFSLNKHHRQGLISSLRLIINTSIGIVTAESENEDFYSAIDTAQEKIEKQLKKIKL